MRVTRTAWPVLPALTAVLVACGGSSSSPSGSTSTTGVSDRLRLWPAPADPMALTRQAGLEPETHEFLENHVHAHLDVFVDGRPVLVPAGIGILITDPAVHTDGAGVSRTYGGIDPACKQVCISPLHTHDTSGILHTESKTAVPNTLGEFLTEWGVPLSDKCLADKCGGVAVYVDGEKTTDDPADIELTNTREIAIVVGKPPAEIPSTADFSQA